MPPFNFIKQEVRPDTIPDLKVDATFRKMSKIAITFALWKIDEDRLEAVSRPQYGIFYDNCAYIIYASSLVGHYATHETITREQKSNVSLERYIHYWLGSNVSEQIRSNVVHKIQELDSYLGNVAAIYRETQNHESARFLSYFKKGYDILSGALINTPQQPRLYQLSGRKWLRSIELPTIEWSHFNSDYIMILKMETITFIWIGRSSSGIERRGALAWVNKQSPNSNTTIVDDGYEQAMTSEEKHLWNSVLPLQKRLVCQANQKKSSSFKDLESNKFRIYKCNQRGRLHLDQLDVGLPAKDDLSDAHGVYLLDNYAQTIWLWVGAQAPQADALAAMGNGRAFVKKKKYPDHTLVIRVLEGHEPVEFKRLFANWLSVWSQENSRGHKPVSTKFGKLDAVSLCERPKMAADTQLVDDGRGERILYRIIGDQMQEISSIKPVVFTTNASYVVIYSVQCATIIPADLDAVGIKTIVYQWNGSEASVDTIAKADKFALKSFEDLQKKGQTASMFVQLYEFDETPHFLQIFEGKLIIMRGQRSTLLNNNNNDFKTNIMLETFLLKIYGDASYNAKAVEELPLSSITSKDCYVIKTSHVWVWCGQSSTGDAREMAKSVGTLLGESSLILEGKETKEFWQSVALYFNQTLVINGNSTNNNCNSCGSSSSTSSSTSGAGSMCNGGNISPTLSNNCYLNTSVPIKPRPPVQLFLVWWQANPNTLHTEEILGFDQEDLCADCTYILDTGLITYVWLGSQALNQEKYTAIAQAYIQNAPFGRRSATALAVVRQYNEPNVFKGFFESWKNDYGKNFISYEEMRRDRCATEAAPKMNANIVNGSAALMRNNHQKDFDGHKKYPVTLLTQEMDMLPTEVNPLKREVHLTHDDFVSIFKMSFYEFDDLPKWKKTELKKLYKLF